jgi:hypothetical protein
MRIDTIKLSGINLEIWRDDFNPDGESTMTVENAKHDLEKLGGEWRLPNFTEMVIIDQLISLGVLGDDPIQKEDYWSNDSDPDYEGFHLTFSFSDEEFYSRYANERLHVRPVRTI